MMPSPPERSLMSLSGLLLMNLEDMPSWSGRSTSFFEKATFRTGLLPQASWDRIQTKLV